MIWFSVWKIKKDSNLSEMQNLIKENITITSEVDWDDDPLLTKFTDKMGSEFDEIQEVEIQESDIKYIYFNLYTERSKRKNSWFDFDKELVPREDRINQYDSDIIFFEYNDEIIVVFLSGCSTAKRIINYVFNDEKWGNFESLDLNINNDLLYWIFKMLLDFPMEKLSDNIDIYLTGLKSYMGKSNDDQNKVRGYGSRIHAMLGTLAFLFNSDKLKNVRPELQYEGQSFLIELALNGTFKVWEEEHQGLYMHYSEKEKKVAILIYVSVVLIPKLVEAYIDNIKRDLWSPQFKLDFVKRLGVDIKDKVDSELLGIQAEIDNNEDDE